ncbi:MAG: hypothetical protein ACR2P5_03585 [Gammaproteobacteria bacterium]
MNFRTSSVDAKLTNVAEHSRTSDLFRVTFIISSIIYIIIDLWIWIDLLNNTLWLFAPIMIGLCISIAYPLFAYGFGYIHAKHVEYNRQFDAIHLVGSIAGQLSMSSGTMAQGFMSAVKLGRELAVPDRQEMTEKLQELDLIKNRIMAEKDWNIKDFDNWLNNIEALPEPSDPHVGTIIKHIETIDLSGTDV